MIKSIEDIHDATWTSMIDEELGMEHSSQSDLGFDASSINLHTSIKEKFDEIFGDSMMNKINIRQFQSDNLIELGNEIKSLRNEWIEMKQVMEICQRNEVGSKEQYHQDKIQELKKNLESVIRAQNESDKKVLAMKKQLEAVYGKKFFEYKK